MKYLSLLFSYMSCTWILSEDNGNDTINRTVVDMAMEMLLLYASGGGIRLQRNTQHKVMCT